MSAEGAIRVATSVAAPGIVSIVGLSFPVAPAAIAVLSAGLVRIPIVRKKSLVSDLCWTGLAMLGAFVTVVDGSHTAGYSFWIGLGFGSLGSGLGEIGRHIMTADLKLRVQQAVKILFGVRDEAP